MKKDNIIAELSNASGRYGSLLIDLMEFCNKHNLQDVTEEEANEFYKELTKE